MKLKSLSLMLFVSLVAVGCQSIPPNSNQSSNSATIREASVAAQNILSQSLVTNALESGKFVAYTDALAQTLAETASPHVIFFHANWCSWCREREKEILENIEALPENTKILKADFDEALDLRTKYGVTTQDTFIFVDSQGQPTLKNGASLTTIETFFVDQTVIPGEERPNGIGGYFEYNADTIASFKDRKAYALFFHASWCPPCRALDKAIKENLTNLPKNTNIFKVDYDNSAELKKLYGVNRQDTFVFFDKAGNPVKVQSGVKLDDITAYFQ